MQGRARLHASGVQPVELSTTPSIGGPNMLALGCATMEINKNWINDKLTARATETKRHKLHSREPSGAWLRSITPDQAYWMRDAYQGDERAQESLERHLAMIIEAHGETVFEPEVLASVILDRVMYYRETPDKVHAEQLGVSPTRYSRKYRDLIGKSEYMNLVWYWWAFCKRLT